MTNGFVLCFAASNWLVSIRPSGYSTQIAGSQRFANPERAAAAPLPMDCQIHRIFVKTNLTV